MSDRSGSFLFCNFHSCKLFSIARAPFGRSKATPHTATPASNLHFANRTNGTSFSRLALYAMVLFAVVAMVTGGMVAQDTTGPAASVNPLIGTGTGPDGSENLFPGPTTPFGLTQISPDTEDRGYGYHYYQNKVLGFSMTHMSGPGCPNEGDVFFTPTTGAVQTQIADFESPYSHSDESAAPGYYRVRLTRWGVNVELTATDRTGLARFTFPAGKPANLLVPISHTLNNTAAAYVRVVNDHQIEGYVGNHVFCGYPNVYKVYFVMTFSRPFAKFGTWNGNQYGGPGTLTAGNRSATQTTHNQWIGAYASWPTANHPQTITAKIGISYVDQAGAENNLKTEAAGKSFSQIRHEDYAIWNKALSVIDVSGGTHNDRAVFYSGLYHSMMMPTIFSDADGRYIGFDQKIHRVAPDHPIYANFSGWDIYRSEIPLLALIEPQRVQDMAQSIVLMYKQGGWVGRWPEANYYANQMAGSPLTIEVANTWLDGLHNFDINTAWEGMLKDATQAPPPGAPYHGEAGIEWINKIHYVPNDKIDYGSVSQIQEDAIAYASLYRLAKDLGKTEDARMLYQRALYYRNVFNHETRYFQPRNADGQWMPNFNPVNDGHHGLGFIEGSGWQYQWFAPTDMAWLIHAVGTDLFNQRLTQFFNYPKPGTLGQYYTPYNETDLQAPFEFNFSGRPWESQRVVRRALAGVYFNGPDGIPGNDDCGEMSSWAVMSMMGIYTVDPTSMAYELVSPVFPKIVVHLKAPYPTKTFTIETSANPQANTYIQSVKLNGRAYQRNWITFHDMTDGSTLHFDLGSSPNHSWGAAPQDMPPSLSDSQP